MSTPAKPSNDGIAGRTNYQNWDKVATDLVQTLEEQEITEKKQSDTLIGKTKHPSSQAEAEERAKAAEVKQAKKTLDGYKDREQKVVQVISDLDLSLGGGDTTYITRDRMEAGTRVLSLSRCTGPGKIVLTQDLSLLTNAVAANTLLQPKSYEADSASPTAGTQPPTKNVSGLIKINLSNLSDLTLVMRCKLITRSIEISHCKNLTLRLEHECTVATIQADLCQNLQIEFHDVLSSKQNPEVMRGDIAYWGDDKNDRVYHAGVSDLSVKVYRDEFLENECVVDYLRNGAVKVGNASEEEMQFLTMVDGGELKTERVVRTDVSEGGGRVVTESEMEDIKKQENEGADFSGIRIESKNGENCEKGAREVTCVDENDGVEEELYASMPQSQIDEIVQDIEKQKTKGNESFAAGEYAQAVFFYAVALDKASQLPDHDSIDDTEREQKSLYPRHVLFSNRSAAFLKLGHHDKALEDASKAVKLDDSHVKSFFRKGLALHAMGQYNEACEVLTHALNLEPKNKQIKQALKFAEMRYSKEMRERMGRG